MGAGRLLVACVVATLAVAVAAAFAAKPGKSGGTDPRGDASPAFTDIRKVSSAETRRGKLRHTIKLDDANGASRALSQIEVKAGGRLYLIGPRGVQKLRLRDGATASARKGTRRARIVRRGNRIVYTLAPELIGEPGRYRWAATMGSNDTSPLELDRAPDAGYLRVRR